jgi:RES domain-containing protein
MQVWRLTRAGFLDQVLSGQGAKKYGGRWNSKGIAMVYASESLELALLEALVHLDPDLVPKDIYQVCFEIDDAFIIALRPHGSRLEKVREPERRFCSSVPKAQIAGLT